MQVRSLFRHCERRPLTGRRRRDEWEQEAGQILVDKSKHLDALLLSEFMLKVGAATSALSDQTLTVVNARTGSTGSTSAMACVESLRSGRRGLTPRFAGQGHLPLRDACTSETVGTAGSVPWRRRAVVGHVDWVLRTHDATA